MKRSHLFFLLMTFIALFSGCNSNDINKYQGYVEAEFVNISSTQSGRLDKLYVKRGDAITKGSNLFVLDHESEVYALRQIDSELSAAQAILSDYQKGSRPEEIAVIEKQLIQAQAASDNAAEQLRQNKALYDTNAVSKTDYDKSLSLAKSTAAKVQELENTLHVAKLPKRHDQIKAQQKRIDQLQSAYAQAAWRVDEKALTSSYDALVFDTLYREGEVVPSGGIIVRLLPKENIKIRFFVPQNVAEKLRVSQKASITSRSDNKAIPLHITYISPEAEFTPPVIYSNETKAKLTYMIEATPDPHNAPMLHPGQPVEVTLE